MALVARAWLAVLVWAGGALPAPAAVHRRCSELVEGQLEGELHALEPHELPPDTRRFELDTRFNQTCGSRDVLGLVVSACDVLPPQLQLAAGDGAEWARLRVLRLGPIWGTLLLEYTVFCEPGDDGRAGARPTTPTAARHITAAGSRHTTTAGSHHTIRATPRAITAAGQRATERTGSSDAGTDHRDTDHAGASSTATDRTDTTTAARPHTTKDENKSRPRGPIIKPAQ